MLKVLIAMDGSENSEHALSLATELFSGKETSITLLHVIPRHLIYGKGGPVVAEVYDPAEEEHASHSLLDSCEQKLINAGVGPTIRKSIEVGDPADLILTVAVEEQADLIVLGSRGLGAARRFLLGSISTKVTTHAHCAVLVAHPKERAAEAAATLQREPATV